LIERRVTAGFNFGGKFIALPPKRLLLFLPILLLLLPIHGYVAFHSHSSALSRSTPLSMIPSRSSSLLVLRFMRKGDFRYSKFPKKKAGRGEWDAVMSLQKYGIYESSTSFYNTIHRIHDSSKALRCFLAFSLLKPNNVQCVVMVLCNRPCSVWVCHAPISGCVFHTDTSYIHH
jgi:hypothetical protein